MQDFPFQSLHFSEDLVNIKDFSTFAALIKNKSTHNKMIVVAVKEGESLEKALKKFKKKFEKTGVVRELRDRQKFTKPSVRKRETKLKAIYKQGLQLSEEV
jgi:small subunit ribosomal protein S21